MRVQQELEALNVKVNSQTLNSPPWCDQWQQPIAAAIEDVGGKQDGSNAVVDEPKHI